MAITTTGNLRKALASAIERAESGKLSATDGKNIIGLANQITASLAVEIKHAEMHHRMGQQFDAIGSLNLEGTPNSSKSK